jgi:Holliday junction resolvase-like predicted endonuclease
VRTSGGEVDLVALDGETVVLVEVKARGKAGTRRPDRVDHAKRTRLRAAWASIARGGLASRPWRFDVVEVDDADGRPRAVLRSEAFRGRG